MPRIHRGVLSEDMAAQKSCREKSRKGDMLRLDLLWQLLGGQHPPCNTRKSKFESAKASCIARKTLLPCTIHGG